MKILKENDKAILIRQDQFNSYEILIKLKNRIRNSTIDFVLPQDEDFGVWAWSVATLDRAEIIFNEITNGIRTVRPMIEFND